MSTVRRSQTIPGSFAHGTFRNPTKGGKMETDREYGRRLLTRVVPQGRAVAAKLMLSPKYKMKGTPKAVRMFPLMNALEASALKLLNGTYRKRRKQKVRV